MEKIAGLFPGQGSQAVGMGKDFYEASGDAKKLFNDADEILGFKLSELCFNGPIETLTLTENVQPAILTVSYIAYVLKNTELTACAGHSLGEYTALIAAGVLNFSDAVSLVHKRGKFMQEAVKEGEGKMVAVLGPSEEEINEVINSFDEGIKEIANLNSPGQIVVSGDNTGVDKFSEIMKSRGGKVIPLNVSAPFHCSLMKPAEVKLSAELDKTEFSDPKIPIYSNVTAKKISSGDEARELLKQQVCSSVRWTDSMVNMVEEQNISTVMEFGQGGVLSKLMKRINKGINRIEVADSNGF